MTRRRLVAILAASRSLTALLQVAWTVVARGSYDWDIEAFLYLGSRLAKGELLYTHDFETKLPLVQYLFHLPSLLGGIGAWRLLNFGLVMGLCFLASRCLVLAQRESRVSRGGEWHEAWYLTSLYLVILYSLPGAWSGQLEMVSGILVYWACALLMTSGRRPIALHVTLDGSSGLLVGLASLIRPNYVYVAAAMLVWMSSGLTGWGSVRPVVSRAVLFVAGFGLAVAAAFMPYVLAGPASLAALADGLRAIGAFSSGIHLGVLLQAQFSFLETGLFYAFLYLGLAFGMLSSHWRRARGRAGSSVEFEMHLLALLASLGLLASLLRNHYWVHNAMLFVPFAAMPALVYSNRLFDWVTSMANRPEISTRFARNIGLATLTAMALAALSAGVHWTSHPAVLGSIRSGISLDINDRNVDPRLLRLLQALHEASISFLAAGYPIYHARLGEPRIGDGHPYMLLRALNGEGLPNVRGIYLFGDEVRAVPCRALTHSGKQVIVAATNDFFYPLSEKCLTAGNSGYAKISSPALAPYVLYVRRDARHSVDSALMLPGR
jgi:hypothetical protein